MPKNGLEAFELEYKKLSAEIAVYLVVLDNYSMLILGYGYKGANEIANNLTRRLGKIGAAFRIESDQIAIIIPSNSPEILIAADADIRCAIRDFGKDKKAHITALTSYATGQGLEPQKMLEKVFANAIRSFEEEDSLEEMKAASDVKEALARGKFSLALQPIIDAKTGAASHHEALLRITNQKGELESAGILIPIAERMGLIDDVDVRVLDMVIAKLKADKTAHLAFNISNLTIGNAEWTKHFFESATEEIAERMIIEITETAAARNMKETAYFIATVQEAGCRVAIDDFGAGYTSFRQVRGLSADYIKLDGSLIHDIATNPHSLQLVASLVEYLSGLGIKTVAEHVDSGEKAKLLLGIGIDYMQGHYFG